MSPGPQITREREPIMVLRSLLVLASVGVLSACAITSTAERGPDGMPVQYIDAMSASVAYQQAAEFCPQGYKLLGEPRQTTPLDYVMTVECRPDGRPPRS